MRQWIRNFLKDDCGALIGSEWAFVATVLVLVGTVSLLTAWQTLLEEWERFVTLLGR